MPSTDNPVVYNTPTPIQDIKFHDDRSLGNDSTTTTTLHETNSNAAGTSTTAAAVEADDTIPVVMCGDKTATKKSPMKRNSTPVLTSLEFLIDSRRNPSETDIFTDKFLTICPKDAITLSVVYGEIDPVDVMRLKNEGTKNVMYKIKITSPEKFRVRPSTGVIGAGETKLIRVHLQHEYKNMIAKEKFLIRAIEVGETLQNSDFTTLWRSADVDSRVEHKLKCYLNEANSSSQSLCQANFTDHMTTPISKHNDQISQQIQHISTTQKYLTGAIILLIILQIFSVIYAAFAYSYIKSLQQHFHCPDFREERMHCSSCS